MLVLVSTPICLACGSSELRCCERPLTVRADSIPRAKLRAMGYTIASKAVHDTMRELACDGGTTARRKQMPIDESGENDDP